MPASRPGSAATAGARAPGPAARLARSAPGVVQVSQLRVKLPVADLPGQVPLRGLADLVAAALLQRQVSQDRPGGRRELITSPSRWRATSRARVRTAGTPRGRTWRGRPAGSHAARRRAGRAPRLAPGIGQAGAVPFQSRFRPVSVRPPTVPVSPVPGTARRFPRRGGQSMSRFRRALAAAAPAHAATLGRGAHDDKLHRRSRGPGPRRHRPQVAAGQGRRTYQPLLSGLIAAPELDGRLGLLPGALCLSPGEFGRVRPRGAGSSGFPAHLAPDGLRAR